MATLLLLPMSQMIGYFKIIVGANHINCTTDSNHIATFGTLTRITLVILIC